MTAIPKPAREAARSAVGNVKILHGCVRDRLSESEMYAVVDAAILAALPHLGEPVEWQRYVETLGWMIVDEDDRRHYLEKGSKLHPLYLAPPALQPVAVPAGWKLVPVKPTDAMAHAAACAHYGKRQADRNGIVGIDVTANDINYSFLQAFRRFWKGALAAAPQSLSAAGPVSSAARLGAVRPPRIVCHKKRGSTYDALGAAEGQISTGRARLNASNGETTIYREVTDGSTIIVYRAHEDGKLWWRFPDEFEDGRFEDVDSDTMVASSAGQLDTVDLKEAASDLLQAYARDNRSVGYRADLWDRLKAIMSREPGCIDSTKTQLAEALIASDQSNHDMLHMVASMISAIRSASPKLAERFQALADAAFEKWPRTETAEALAAFEKDKAHG